VLLVIIGIRGSFGDKPINVINAFGQGSSQYGNLTLNGVFSVYHVSRSASSIKHNFFTQEVADKTALSIIVDDNQIVHDKNYPISRIYKDFSIKIPDNKKLNVVFFPARKLDSRIYR